MFSLRLQLPLMAVTTFLLLGPFPVLAQKPAWTPIAELLIGSLAESDPVKMSDVMTRCTALNMILAGMNTDVSPASSQLYRDEAYRLIQLGVLIESHLAKDLTGLEADIQALSNAAVGEVQTILVGYNQWLDENIAVEGSYFNKDIDAEIDSCQLASKLATSF